MVLVMADRDELFTMLKAVEGYLMNARIDLQTSTKARAIATLDELRERVHYTIVKAETYDRMA